MKRGLSILALALLAGAGCSRGANKPADTALNTDLSLAQQQRGYQPIDSLSAAERGLAAPSNAGVRAPVATRRTSSGGEVTRRRSTRSTASSGTTTTTTTTSSGGTVVKHTQRDAAIGAAAGAVIGAATSKNKVKGGLIGAAVGGILGGVIGNNVDKKKKP